MSKHWTKTKQVTLNNLLIVMMLLVATSHCKKLNISQQSTIKDGTTNDVPPEGRLQFMFAGVKDDSSRSDCNLVSDDPNYEDCNIQIIGEAGATFKRVSAFKIVSQTNDAINRYRLKMNQFGQEAYIIERITDDIKDFLDTKFLLTLSKDSGSTPDTVKWLFDASIGNIKASSSEAANDEVITTVDTGQARDQQNALVQCKPSWDQIKSISEQIEQLKEQRAEFQDQLSKLSALSAQMKLFIDELKNKNPVLDQCNMLFDVNQIDILGGTIDTLPAEVVPICFEKLSGIYSLISTQLAEKTNAIEAIQENITAAEASKLSIDSNLVQSEKNRMAAQIDDNIVKLNATKAGLINEQGNLRILLNKISGTLNASAANSITTLATSPTSGEISKEECTLSLPATFRGSFIQHELDENIFNGKGRFSCLGPLRAKTAAFDALIQTTQGEVSTKDSDISTLNNDRAQIVASLSNKNCAISETAAAAASGGIGVAGGLVYQSEKWTLNIQQKILNAPLCIDNSGNNGVAVKNRNAPRKDCKDPDNWTYNTQLSGITAEFAFNKEAYSHVVIAAGAHFNLASIIAPLQKSIPVIKSLLGKAGEILNVDLSVKYDKEWSEETLLELNKLSIENSPNGDLSEFQIWLLKFVLPQACKAVIAEKAYYFGSSAYLQEGFFCPGPDDVISNSIGDLYIKAWSKYLPEDSASNQPGQTTPAPSALMRPAPSSVTPVIQAPNEVFQDSSNKYFFARNAAWAKKKKNGQNDEWGGVKLYFAVPAGFKDPAKSDVYGDYKAIISGFGGTPASLFPSFKLLERTPNTGVINAIDRALGGSPQFYNWSFRSPPSILINNWFFEDLKEAPNSECGNIPVGFQCYYLILNQIADDSPISRMVIDCVAQHHTSFFMITRENNINFTYTGSFARFEDSATVPEVCYR